MTLEEMQDAIASNTKPPRQTVAAMFGGKMPSYATLARREDAARVRGQKIDRPAPKTPATDGRTASLSIARAKQKAQRAALTQERITLIIAALESSPMTVRTICGLTGIPESSAHTLMEKMLNDGKVSRVKRHNGAVWTLETP